MAIGLTVTKPFAEKCRSLCTLIGECVHAKVMAAFLDSKINMMHSFNLHIFWWMYMVYVTGQSYGNQADGVHAANASTDIYK